MTYYQKHREEILEKYQNNKEEYVKKVLERKATDPMARATQILHDCNRADRKHGREKGDLTREWIAEQIQKGCTYKDKCGTTDWRKIGLNRKDNSLPHTKANCEPCCYKCNNELNWAERRKKVYQYELVPKLVKVWESAYEAKENGYDQSSIQACCVGKNKKHKGYIWSYKPLD